MKRNLIKLISVFVVATFLFNTAVLAADTSVVGVSSKLAKDVQAKLAEIPDNEKISVYLYLKDTSNVVMSTMASKHSDLYTTYKAAVESSDIPLNTSVLTANENQRTTSAQNAQLQTAIETKRELHRTHYATANNAILSKYCSDDDLLFVSSYVPMAIVSVTPKELKQMILDTSVEHIALFENKETTNSSLANANKNSRADYVRDTLDYDGTGVKIGQLEEAVPDINDPYLASANIITNTSFGGQINNATTNHATFVARIMVCSSGVAPSATLYSASASSLIQHYNAIDWLISQGVNVINMSANIPRAYSYDPLCAYIDHLAVQHDVHFVVSAGNKKAANLDLETYVISPGMAYNAITVGAYNDNNTAPADDSQIYDKQKDDYLETYSKYSEYASDCRPCKPNLVASGNGFWNDSGTSYAAPQVTGVIAQLCSYNASLKTKQTCMGAILAASCGRKLASEVQSGTEIITSGYFKGGDFLTLYSVGSSDNQISNTQGAGKLDAYWAWSIVANGNYWSATVSATTTTYTQSVYITKGSTTLTRVALYWLKRNLADSQHNITETELPNWNLKVYGPDGSIVGTSSTFYSNFEIIQFVPPSSGTYRIEISRAASSNNTQSNIGLAVW